MTWSLYQSRNPSSFLCQPQRVRMPRVNFACLKMFMSQLWASHWGRLNRKYLQDSVHVFSCVVQASPHDHIVDPSREVSVRLLVQIHLCDSVFHHGPVFFGGMLALPPHPVGVSYGVGFPGQEVYV